MGFLSSTSYPQVCAHLPRIRTNDEYSAIQKFSAASRLDRWCPDARNIPSVLYNTSTTLGSRGMVQPTRRTLWRNPATLGLGNIAAVRSIPDIVDPNASRK